MQKRTGKLQQVIVNAIASKVKGHSIFKQDRKKNETFFNHRLYRDVKSINGSVTNKQIWVAKLVGETFRPEFYIANGRHFPLLCAECKKLTDATAKTRLKEGLSQALVYSNEYKCVLLIFYDYTSGSKYASHFGSPGSSEERLAAKLWLNHSILVIFLVPL